MLDLSRAPVVLYGGGTAAIRRLDLLQQAGAEDLHVFSADPDLIAAAGPAFRGAAPNEAALAGVRAIFVAGLDDATSGQTASLARRLGVLVNVEDRRDWCDFYTPSLVRRGDLVLAVSTGGRSPGLARRLRERLEREYGPEWADRLDRLSHERERWRREGCDMQTVMRRTNNLIEKEGWL